MCLKLNYKAIINLELLNIKMFRGNNINKILIVFSKNKTFLSNKVKTEILGFTGRLHDCEF